MIEFLIDTLLGTRNKCWKCKYFLNHEDIEKQKLENYPRSKHVGLCTKIKGFYESKSYNGLICSKFKKRKEEKKEKIISEDMKNIEHDLEIVTNDLFNILNKFQNKRKK